MKPNGIGGYAQGSGYLRRRMRGANQLCDAGFMRCELEEVDRGTLVD
jgi:hypothetical protein